MAVLYLSRLLGQETHRQREEEVTTWAGVMDLDHQELMGLLSLMRKFGTCLSLGLPFPRADGKEVRAEPQLGLQKA
jgi:hypothetical protein